jgi:ATP-dependent helicase HrpA
MTAPLIELLASELVPFQGSMLPALARAASAATGVEVPVEALRADAIPGHLRLTCRILGDRDRVIAQSRDVAALLTAHGAHAREVFQRSAPAVKWERTGLTTWEFGELPEFVSRTVLGARVRAYPALVDVKTCVDLKLLEAADIAIESTRAGVLRLCALGAQKALASAAKQLPAPFPRADRMPPSRSEVEAFRERVLWRVVQESFGISDAARSARGSIELPRTQAAFKALFAAGAPRIEASATRVGRSVQAAAAALQKGWQALAAAASQPSGTHAARDIRAQIDLLFPGDLLSRVELERLDQFPRYLRAAETRLARAITDPRKDADKLSPFAPLWKEFLDKRASYRDRDGAEALRWAFEELRVAIFAPELKPAFSVSVASLARELRALR